MHGYLWPICKIMFDRKASDHFFPCEEPEEGSDPPSAEATSDLRSSRRKNLDDHSYCCIVLQSKRNWKWTSWPWKCVNNITPRFAHGLRAASLLHAASYDICVSGNALGDACAIFF